VDSFSLTDVYAGYGGTDVLRGVSLEVTPGTCVVVLGPNGAGKSTLLNVLSGQLRPHKGTRTIAGEDATAWRAHKSAAAGVRWVGEPRPVYPGMSVDDNLAIGGFARRKEIDVHRKRVYDLLPELEKKRGDRAGSLSGGQQQMLAIGQALMSEPAYLCLDEPSIGLAPQVVSRVAELIRRLADSGVGIVWAEQFAEVALSRCDRVAVISAGAILRDCAPAELDTRDLEAAYMGMAHQVEEGARPPQHA
jgi:ABC-type branched-subunit amino acid transport system ATPase component